MAISQEEIITHARAGLGTPYVWGGNDEKGWDCSGFVLDVLRDTGAVPKDFPDTNAEGIWQWAKKNGPQCTLEQAFASACSLIFRWSGGKMVHVAFASRGDVVEARGKAYGTVERDNPGTFTHAARIPGVWYE